MARVTIATINSAFQSNELPNVSIHRNRAEGNYLYLEYDDLFNNIYETESFYAMTLDNPCKDCIERKDVIEFWVRTAKEFSEKVEKKFKEFFENRLQADIFKRKRQKESLI